VLMLVECTPALLVISFPTLACNVAALQRLGVSMHLLEHTAGARVQPVSAAHIRRCKSCES
jgi:hypothetical protein